MDSNAKALLPGLGSRFDSAGLIRGALIGLSVSILAAASQQASPPPVPGQTQLLPSSLPSVAVAAAPGSPSFRALQGYISARWGASPSAAQVIISQSEIAAARESLDPLLILAVVARESSFVRYGNALSTSTTAKSEESDPLKAHGPMQVAGRWHAEKMPVDSRGAMRATTLPENISIGTTILREYLVAERGNMVRALQRYNGNLGDGAARYANWVLQAHKDLRQALLRQPIHYSMVVERLD